LAAGNPGDLWKSFYRRGAEAQSEIAIFAPLHLRVLALELFPLARGFVKKNRRGRANVERIHRRWHGNRHRLITGLQNRRGNPVAFAAKYEAAIAGKIRLRQKLFIRVRMRGDATDAMGAKF